jgi:DNA-binding NtrC family response regulator
MVPPLRDRKDDIYLLFRKFAADFAEKYRMPVIQLDEEARNMLENYRWPGNVRQLKNITEQISIIEEKRQVNADTLRKYLPESFGHELPVLYGNRESEKAISERDLLYKVLFDMKKDINELRKVVAEILDGQSPDFQANIDNRALQHYREQSLEPISDIGSPIAETTHDNESFEEPFEESEVIEESLSLQDKEIDLIKKALEKYNGRRKNAAKELGISERTLYRKIKEYDIRG